MRFKVLDGQHVQDGKTYRKGQIVESVHELDLTFTNKFERLAGDAGPAGVDFTSRFPQAAAEGFTVFRRGGRYFVYDQDGDLVGDEQGLPQSKVVKAIREAVGGD